MPRYCANEVSRDKHPLPKGSHHNRRFCSDACKHAARTAVHTRPAKKKPKALPAQSSGYGVKPMGESLDNVTSETAEIWAHAKVEVTAAQRRLEAAVTAVALAKAEYDAATLAYDAAKQHLADAAHAMMQEM